MISKIQDLSFGFILFLIKRTLDILLLGPRLAGPKLWNAINTDTRGKCPLNAFKTAYKKQLIIFYH